MLKTGLVGNPTDPQMQTVMRHPGFEVSGFCDTSDSNQAEYYRGAPARLTEKELIEKTDALIFKTITPGTTGLLSEALKNSRHAMLLNTDGLSAEDITCLIKLSEESQTVIQARKNAHANPALDACYPMIAHPLLMEIKMMTSATLTGQCDPGIAGNLHKIVDIILSVCTSNVKKVYALKQPGGASFFGFLSARIEFDNGSAASIIYTTLTGNEGFEIDIYQKDRLMKVDVHNNRLGIYDKTQTGRKVSYKYSEFGRIDDSYLYYDLERFSRAVATNSTAGRDLFDMYKTTELNSLIRQKAGITK